jgi:hypothetical protein
VNDIVNKYVGQTDELALLLNNSLQVIGVQVDYADVLWIAIGVAALGNEPPRTKFMYT